MGLGFGCEDLESVSAQAEQMLDKLVAAAQDELLQNGSEQKVTACVTKMYFDTREYEGFTMPAGEYNAVRFTIGEGKGHNWWCVVFPTLCVPASSEGFQETAEASGLSSQLAGTLTREEGEYEIRFQFLDWLGQVKNWLHS